MKRITHEVDGFFERTSSPSCGGGGTVRTYEDESWRSNGSGSGNKG